MDIATKIPGATMPNTFDPYREALVIEQQTVWPEKLTGSPIGETERRRIENRLHSDPATATELEYVRLHAGFVRRITVTEADLKQ
jgi:hypothetical protein